MGWEFAVFELLDASTNLVKVWVLFHLMIVFDCGSVIWYFHIKDFVLCLRDKLWSCIWDFRNRSNVCVIRCHVWSSRGSVKCHLWFLLTKSSWRRSHWVSYLSLLYRLSLFFILQQTLGLKSWFNQVNLLLIEWVFVNCPEIFRNKFVNNYTNINCICSYCCIWRISQLNNFFNMSFINCCHLMHFNHFRNHFKNFSSSFILWSKTFEHQKSC